MKTILPVIGILMILVGGVFFLQGMNILPGSSMTGVTFWAVVGIILVVLGIVLITLQIIMRRRA